MKLKQKFLEKFKKQTTPKVSPGDKIRVHQKITEEDPRGRKKEKTLTFEGTVISKKHGEGINSTITVRKVIEGVGVEKIFPLHSPAVFKIEVISRGKVKKSKLYYLKDKSQKKSRLKREAVEDVVFEEKEEEKKENEEEETEENKEEKDS